MKAKNYEKKNVLQSQELKYLILKNLRTKKYVWKIILTFYKLI